MEYTVDLDARVAAVSDDALDQFLTALERRVMGPAVSFNGRTGSLQAIVTVAARNARDAAAAAADAFSDALREVGLPPDADFTALHVVPTGREETAALA